MTTNTYLFTFRHLSNEDYKYIEEAYEQGLCFEFDMAVVGHNDGCLKLINILSNIFAIVGHILVDNGISEKCIVGYEAVGNKPISTNRYCNCYWLHPIYELDIEFHVPKSICVPPHIFEYNCPEYHWFEKYSQTNIRFLSTKQYNEVESIPISVLTTNDTKTKLYYHKKVFSTPHEKAEFLKTLIRRLVNANDDKALESLLHYQYRPIMPTEWVEIGNESCHHYYAANTKPHININVPVSVYKVDKEVIDMVTYPYTLYFGRYNHILRRYDIQVYTDYDNYIVYMPAVDDQHAYVTDRRLCKLMAAKL